MDNVKHIIISVLNNAHNDVCNQVPLTKIATKSIQIDDIKPVNLLSFMQENKIPDNAYFNGRNNGYDGFDAILLEWAIDVPTTEKDKAAFLKKRFNTIAGSRVYKTLSERGYKREGFNSGLLAAYDDTTVYDMYIAKDWDRLLNYFSLAFPQLKD